MKKIALLLSVLSATSVCFAAEPLLLEPLSPTVLSEQYGVDQKTAQEVTTKVKDGVYEATYTPSYTPGENMVPQNAAAEGKPVTQKGKPRVRIETKQGRRTNTQWNPGGKGTKSFF